MKAELVSAYPFPESENSMNQHNGRKIVRIRRFGDFFDDVDGGGLIIIVQIFIERQGEISGDGGAEYVKSIKQMNHAAHN